jgi:hypothetical protein
MTQCKPTTDQKRKALRRSDQMSLLDDDFHQTQQKTSLKPRKAPQKKTIPKSPPAPEPNYDPDTLDLFLDQNFLGAGPPCEGAKIQPRSSNLQKLSPESANHSQNSPVANLETAAVDLQALLRELNDIRQMLDGGDSNHEDRDL